LRKCYSNTLWGLSDPPELEIAFSLTGRVIVLAVVGEIDMANAAKFGSAIESVFDENRRVVVDLTDVRFFDSSGLAALVRGGRTLGERGIDLWVVAPRAGVVRQVLALTELDQMFPIVDSRDAALT
jgi:anti-sigma B factor antagonist